MNLDEEERRLVRKVREGDDAALVALRALWLRSFALNEALSGVAGEPLEGALVSIVQARVVLMWMGGARKWEVVAFERDE